jgi:trimethylamine--corrinoid protein Co-methyltransferase
MALQGYTRKFKPLELLNEEQLIALHKASLDVLETTGVRVEHPRALKLYEQHGCRVDYGSNRVRIPPGLVEECLRRTPSSYRVRARDPHNDLIIGGDTVYFQPFPGMDAIDHQTWETHRPTRKENYDNAILMDALENAHFMTCYTPFFGWQGVPAVMSILESDAARIRCSAKTIETASSYESEKFAIKLGRAVGSEIWGYMGGSPPLTWYENAIEACFTLLEADQPLQIISGNTMGASGPVTIAGATVINNAELMSGLVLAQLVRPGARLLMMDFCFPQNMRTGSPSFGGIETYLHNVVFNQIWRWYGVPTKTPPPGMTDSKRIDYQNGTEKATGVVLAALSGANMIPLMGGVYGELSWDPIQAILDNDLGGMVGRLLEGVEVTDLTMALDLINEIGPIPGHYLGTTLTRQMWKKEFFVPRCSDRLTYHEWLQSGKKSCLDYAKQRMEEILSTHEISPLTDAQERDLEAVLIEARAHYRKTGQISDEEWEIYQKQIKSKHYPFA